MTALDARKAELQDLLASAPQPPLVIVHPRMGDRYREEVGRLRDALNDASRREEAAEIIRGLIDSIMLHPSGAGRDRTLTIDLSGHLAGLLNLARQTKKGADGAPVSDRQLKLVAGVGFEPTTFRL
jgi:site-specific DNA recombinase